MVEHSSEWASALDHMQIREVRRGWVSHLDLGEWDALAACFHPDAVAVP